jgi:hypothetical protein
MSKAPGRTAMRSSESEQALRHRNGKSWWSCIRLDFERVIDIGSVCRFAAPFDICSEQSPLIKLAEGVLRPFSVFVLGH